MADRGLQHAASLVPIGAFAGKPAMPLTRSVVVIGSGPHARFLLKSETVSTSHTLLIHTAQGWYFRDLVSRTHTILNGKSLRESPIKSGDTLTIGKFVFHFVSVGKPADVAAPKPASLEITDAEIPVPIDTKTMLIGRRVGCEVRLIEESVSLVHACLFEADGVHYIRDLYSRTGTFLNGKKVHQEPLKYGDIVVIGETSLRYVPDESGVSSDFGSQLHEEQLVELEPFGVDQPLVAARLPANDDSLSHGSVAGGSVVGEPTESPTESPADAPIEDRETDHSPVSLVPTAVVPVAEDEAAGAGVALAEVSPAGVEARETILHIAPVVIERVATPNVIDLADEVAEPLAEPLADDESLSDVRVVPVNRRDAFDAPTDERVEAEVGTEKEVPLAPANAARAADIEPAVADESDDEIDLVDANLAEEARPSAAEIGAAEREAAERDAAEREAADIEAEILGVPTTATAAEVKAPPIIEPDIIEPDAIEPDVIEPDVIEPEPIVVETPALSDVGAPLELEADVDEVMPSVVETPTEPTPAACAVEAEHDEDAPILDHAIAEQASANELDHEVASEPLHAEPHDDPPIGPPGIEASALPPSPEVSELAALQERIRAALADPSTMARQPLLPEERNAPAPKLSEAGRRARTIAELLESNEEFEEEAEREAQSISFPTPEPTAVGPALPEPPLASIEDAAVEAPTIAFDLANDVAAETVAEIAEPEIAEPEIAEPEIAASVADDFASDTSITEETDESANVVEANGPAAIAEMMRDADAGAPVGMPAGTRDVASDAEPLSLAAGESAVIGDEDDLVATAPGVDDVTEAAPDEPIQTMAAITETVMPDESLMSESAADTLAALDGEAVAEPTSDNAEPSPESPSESSSEAPTGSSSEAAIEEVPVKGRRGRKVAAPKTKKEPAVRKPPRGKKAIAEAEAAAAAAAAAAAESEAAARAAAIAASAAAIVPPVDLAASQVAIATAERAAELIPHASPFSDATMTEAAAADVISDEPALHTTIEVPAAGIGSVNAPVDEATDKSRSSDTPVTIAAAFGESTSADDSIAAALDEVSFEQAADASAAPTTIAALDDVAVEADVQADAPLTHIDVSFEPAADVDAVTPIVAVEKAIEGHAPTTLDAIANVAQPAALPIEEVPAPTMLAAEPDELPTQIDDARAPVEADAYHAGEAIVTTPVMIDALPIENVAPMFDPDPGTFAEHDARDTAAADDELPARPVDEASGEPSMDGALVDLSDGTHDAETVLSEAIDADASDTEVINQPGAVVIVDEVDGRGDEAAIIVDDARVEALPELTVGEVSSMADAVEPALESGLTTEPPDAAERVGLDVEALADLDVAADAPTNVAFTQVDVASESTNEAFAVAGEQLAPVADEEAAPAIEGTWLTPADANTAAALAGDASGEYRAEQIVDDAGAVTLELSGPSSIVEASGPLIAEPAPLDGSTLSTATSLPLDAVASLADFDRAWDADLVEQTTAPIEPEFESTPMPSLADAGEEEPLSDWRTPSAELGDDLGDAFGSALDEPLGRPLGQALGQPPGQPMGRPLGAPLGAPLDAPLGAIPNAPRAIPPSPIAVRNAPGQAVINVNVPTLEEFEQTFHDAFADALAMAEGANFGAMNAPPVQPVAETPAPVRPAPPKWELDTSLLDQLENPGANPLSSGMSRPAAGAGGGAASGAMGGGGAAAFMSLGGIGWIGDESADEFESVPSSLRPVNPNGIRPLNAQIGGAMSARRASRRRRPVPGDAASAPTPITDDTTEATFASEHATPASTVSDVLSVSTAAEPNEVEIDDLAELMAAPSEAVSSPLDADDLGTTIASSEDELFADRGVASEEKTESTQRPSDIETKPAAGKLRPATPRRATPIAELPAVELPRPVRRARPEARTDVDQALNAGAAHSPFAAQALPLVDSFSPGNGPVPVLNDVLAKFGAAEGRIKGHPPITQDRPSNQNVPGQSALGPSPFASVASIDEEIETIGPSRGVRRTRQRINKLPILIYLMTGLMAVGALGSWYAPVPITVRGEVPFANVEKQSDLARASTQDAIRATLPNLDKLARQMLDDRYSNGFLDRHELYAQVIEKARFDPSLPGTLIIDYPSSLNQRDADVARMNELVKQIVKANQSFVDAQKKLQDTAQTLERTIARDKERVAVLAKEIERVHAIAEGGPDGKEVRRAETELKTLEEAKKAAAADVDAKEAELKRLESNPTAFVPASLIQEDEPVFADANDGLAAAPTTKPVDAQAELSRLQSQLDATKSRLGQLEAAQNPEAKSARDGFDAALGAFASDVETARATLGDRPEVLKYIESASKLQAQTRSITETLIRRQQQGLTQMNELKQRLVELKGAHRDQRVAGDEQLRGWSDQIAIKERLLNAARDDRADPKAIGDLERDIETLKKMVAGKEEALSDPQQRSVDEKLEEMLRTTQRNMEADRADNEKMLADVQAEFKSQQPAVEKLPDDQKKLGESLAGRLAQIDLARQRYADSLVKVAGGEALQITELRKKVEELAVSVARQQPLADAEAVAQAADMERRAEAAKLVDAARNSVNAARAARDAAVAAFDAKAQVLAGIITRRDAASAARQQVETMEAEQKVIEARQAQSIVDRAATEARLKVAVVPLPSPTVRVIEPQHDPRLAYGASAIAVIGLIFGPLIYRENRNRPAVNRSQAQTADAGVMPGNAHVA